MFRLIDAFRLYIIIGTDALSHVPQEPIIGKIMSNTFSEAQARGVSGGRRRSRGRRAKDAAWHGWRCSQQSGSDRTQRSSTVGDAAGGARREWTKKAWGQESIYILQMIGVREVVESYAKKNLRE
jgi:hypothetical protein